MKQCTCSFCGRKEDEIKKLIKSPKGDICICSDCIAVCCELLDAETTPTEKNASAEETVKESAQLTPSKIKRKLDDCVIAQEEAKKILSVAVYNHYKRISASQEIRANIKKSNILMIGPSGTGKTLLAQTLASLLNVPFAICDATQLTEAGYVGEDVDSVLYKLFQISGNDLAKTQKGIVYIDEIDKISKKGSGSSFSRDVGGEGVQESLLKMIEGATVTVPLASTKNRPAGQTISIDTSDILFICGGAFDGLEEILRAKKNNHAVGFQANGKQSEKISLKDVEVDDLKKYGLIPELIGRLPVIAVLDELDEGNLIKILKEPKGNLVDQYIALFQMDGIDLSFTDAALQKIAQSAIEKNTGARGLRAIMEHTLTPLMYELPDDKNICSVTITENTIFDGQAIIKRAKESAERYSTN